MIEARLYTHHSADPYFNMACDNWLLGSVEQQPAAFVIRTYTWSVGTITLGANQNAELAYDHARVGATPVIRRITGGRALYHDPSELTYAIAVNTADLPIAALTRSIGESSRALSIAIAKFLTNIGIESNLVPHSSPHNARPAFFHTAPCFASSARHELMARSGKIVASAQKRSGSSLLQHGAIKLGGVASHAALPPIPGALSAEPAPLELVRFSECTSKFADAFAAQFDLSVTATTLSAREHGEVMALAEKLRADTESIKQSAG